MKKIMIFLRGTIFKGGCQCHREGVLLAPGKMKSRLGQKNILAQPRQWAKASPPPSSSSHRVSRRRRMPACLPRSGRSLRREEFGGRCFQCACPAAAEWDPRTARLPYKNNILWVCYAYRNNCNWAREVAPLAQTHHVVWRWGQAPPPQERHHIA